MSAEYLIFGIGEEHYGIEILSVKEIRSYTMPTKIINMPSYYKGVIDLRGAIIPIIDTRIKFNLPDITYTDTTIVIVVTVEEKDIGLVVDSVEEVTTFEDEEVQPSPNMEDSLISGKTIIGIASKENTKMTMIVNTAMFVNDIRS